MDNQRLLAWAFFALMAWMTYQTWVMDYAPKPEPAQVDSPALSSPQGAASETADAAVDEELPEISDPNATTATCWTWKSVRAAARCRKQPY